MDYSVWGMSGLYCMAGELDYNLQRLNGLQGVEADCIILCGDWVDHIVWKMNRLYSVEAE